MLFVQLFLSFFQIGLFSIGGGYAAMPLIQHQVVELHNWLSVQEFTDIITISQMTPGPIAINSASFVGIQMAGIPGAIVATAGCVFPSCIIVLLLAWVYFKYRNLSTIQGILFGLRPAVVAMIASAGLSIFCTSLWESGVISLAATDWLSLLIFAGALFTLQKFHCNPIWVMIGAGVSRLILEPLLRAVF